MNRTGKEGENQEATPEKFEYRPRIPPDLEISMRFKRLTATPERRVEAFLDYLIASRSRVNGEESISIDRAVSMLRQIIGEEKLDGDLVTHLKNKATLQVLTKEEKRRAEWTKVKAVLENTYNSVLQGVHFTEKEIEKISSEANKQLDSDYLMEWNIPSLVRACIEDGVYDRKAIAEGRPTVTQMRETIESLLALGGHLDMSRDFYALPRLKQLEELYEVARAVERIDAEEESTPTEE